MNKIERFFNKIEKISEEVKSLDDEEKNIQKTNIKYGYYKLPNVNKYYVWKIKCSVIYNGTNKFPNSISLKIEFESAKTKEEAEDRYSKISPNNKNKLKYCKEYNFKINNVEKYYDEKDYVIMHFPDVAVGIVDSEIYKGQMIFLYYKHKDKYIMRLNLNLLNYDEPIDFKVDGCNFTHDEVIEKFNITSKNINDNNNQYKQKL